jgi:mono/diheme cytochrome c family protein
MPPFEEKLSDEEIRALILYLKTLWEPEQREFQARASERDPFP